MPVTRYDAGVTGFSSTFIFRKVILSPWAALISSRIGETWRHGPHHSAQKSTRTGLSDLRTCVSNSESVTAGMLPTVLPFGGSAGGLGVPSEHETGGSLFPCHRLDGL